ncbi:DNA-binding HxlR family transcriptional regulator [Nocardia transvalensis]|uniref:DNA-binding HxlR family transcriptional regulator n=1 Tax=Nocardia transvalensis TaxID=37333 RepID=A0A7W9P934_9NOCA|nr:helix-turn-helix domain-containing protein [Nocardia transvalensis]MBB5911414.1 DNA-binding HxlR family transcriptional regulator [Nocardia transvalensis]
MSISKDGTFDSGGEVQVTTRRGDLFHPACPTRRLLDRIGTKWVSMVVKLLAEAAPGELRFAELRRRMPGVSQKMLSVTLQNLTADGLVARRVEPTVPPKVHYRLTELGLSLEVPLSALRTWAEENMATIDEALASGGALREMS